MATKRLAILAILLSAVFASAQEVHLVAHGNLSAVERLTDSEQKELADARAKVEAAQTELETVQARIAGAHKFGKESYMEWSRWYEFDGDFILQRSVSSFSHATLNSSVPRW